MSAFIAELEARFDDERGAILMRSSTSSLMLSVPESHPVSPRLAGADGDITPALRGFDRHRLGA